MPKPRSCGVETQNGWPTTIPESCMVDLLFTTSPHRENLLHLGDPMTFWAEFLLRFFHVFDGKKRKLTQIPPWKLRWQGKIHHLKMYFPLNMGIFQSHVSFQGCRWFRFSHNYGHYIIVADDKCSSGSDHFWSSEVFHLPHVDPCCILLPRFVGGSVLIVS